MVTFLIGAYRENNVQNNEACFSHSVQSARLWEGKSMHFDFHCGRNFQVKYSFLSLEF